MQLTCAICQAGDVSVASKGGGNAELLEYRFAAAVTAEMPVAGRMAAAPQAKVNGEGGHVWLDG